MFWKHKMMVKEKKKTFINQKEKKSGQIHL